MTTEDKFLAAVNVIKGLPKNGPYQPSQDMKLLFYGLYKQATEGSCTEPKPSFYQVVAGYKWRSWSCLGDLSKSDAMERYVVELKKIVETMSYSADVATFMEVLGSFYEYVDVSNGSTNNQTSATQIKEATDASNDEAENSAEDDPVDDDVDNVATDKDVSDDEEEDDNQASKSETSNEEPVIALTNGNCKREEAGSDEVACETAVQEYEVPSKLEVTGSSSIEETAVVDIKALIAAISAPMTDDLKSVRYADSQLLNGDLTQPQPKPNGILARGFFMPPTATPIDQDYKQQHQLQQRLQLQKQQIIHKKNRLESTYKSELVAKEQEPPSEGSDSSDTEDEYSETTEALIFNHRPSEEEIESNESNTPRQTISDVLRHYTYDSSIDTLRTSDASSSDSSFTETVVVASPGRKQEGYILMPKSDSKSTNGIVCNGVASHPSNGVTSHPSNYLDNGKSSIDVIIGMRNSSTAASHINDSFGSGNKGLNDINGQSNGFASHTNNSNGIGSNIINGLSNGDALHRSNKFNSGGSGNNGGGNNASGNNGGGNNASGSGEACRQQGGSGGASSNPTTGGSDDMVLVLRQMQGDLQAMTQCLQAHLNDISQCLTALHQTSLALQNRNTSGGSGDDGDRNDGRGAGSSELQQRRQRQWWPFPELSPRSTFWLLLWPIALHAAIKLIKVVVASRRRNL